MLSNCGTSAYGRVSVASHGVLRPNMPGIGDNTKLTSLFNYVPMGTAGQHQLRVVATCQRLHVALRSEAVFPARLQV